MAKHLFSPLPIPSALLMLIFLFSVNPASAQTDDLFGGNSFSSALDESPFLRVMDAFIPTLIWGMDRDAQVEWYIEPDYYLYRARFAYQTDSGLEVGASYPTGVTKFDDFFQEDLEVYYSNLLINLDIPEDTQNLYVQFQGCAEAGLCYPPTWIGFDIDTSTGSAGYMGELSNGPPVQSLASKPDIIPAPNETMQADEDGLPITLLIGFLSGLLVLSGIVIFSLRKDS